MMVEHNTDLDKEAKRYLPEGFNLDVDRSFDAENIVTDINKWKDKTNRVDLKDFDTKSAREPKPKDIIEDLTGKTSGEQVLMSEPYRLTGKGQTGRLLKQYKREIRDFESFKKVIKKAWINDASLRNLWKEVQESGDDVFKPMFETELVQKWIEENLMPDIIRYLTKRFNIEPRRAENVYKRLPTKRKKSLLNRLNKGNKVKIKETKKVEPIIRRIRQKSSSGTIYRRTKPMKWTDRQAQFINSRRGLPIARILEQYNDFYRSSQRTISSIRNKLYRTR